MELNSDKINYNYNKINNNNNKLEIYNLSKKEICY